MIDTPTEEQIRDKIGRKIKLLVELQGEKMTIANCDELLGLIEWQRGLPPVLRAYACGYENGVLTRVIVGIREHVLSHEYKGR